MKIISKHRDYYDNVQGVMYDGDMIYHRKQETIKCYLKIDCRFNNLQFIGFCGKLYPVFVYGQKHNTHDMTWTFDIDNKIMKSSNLIKKSFFMSGEKYSKTICVYDLGIAHEIYHQNNKQRNKWNAPDKLHIFKDKINTSVQDIEKLNIFQKHATPYFSLRIKHYGNLFEITTAPTLSDYRFQEIFDPYTCYQELVMWIGNQAVSEYPPQIKDDKVIRDSKGFDNWSFKSKWSEKKQRRSRK